MQQPGYGRGVAGSTIPRPGLRTTVLFAAIVERTKCGYICLLFLYAFVSAKKDCPTSIRFLAVSTSLADTMFDEENRVCAGVGYPKDVDITLARDYLRRVCGYEQRCRPVSSWYQHTPSR